MRSNPTPVPSAPAGIYVIRHIPSGRIYVGSSRLIRTRWKAHLVALRSGTHHLTALQQAWNEDGQAAFVLDVLEAVDDPASLTVREQHWLNELKATDPQLGFNLSATSTGSGTPHTEAWKRRQSEYARTVTAPMLRSITDEQATAIAHAVAAGESDASVGLRLGVSRSTVSRIVTGFVYKHLDIPRRQPGTSRFRDNRALTPEQVVEIRRRKQAGERTRLLMLEFNVNQVTIDRIARGATYRDQAATT